MTFLYYIGVQFYGAAIKFWSPFNTKAAQWVKGRANWRTQLKSIPPSDKRVWVHCASLGEFEQALPIIKKIEKQHFQVLVSFFSPSGYEIIKSKNRHSPIIYLPLDSPKNAKDFVELVRPKFVLFVKYEFWFFYWKALVNKHIPFFVVSAAFRPKQIFFRWYGSWYKQLLKMPNHIFCQHQASVELLHKHHITHTSLSGDTRYDRVLEIKQASDSVAFLEKFSANRFVIVAGSSWEKEEKLLTDYLKQSSSVYAIIAPHDVSQVHVNKIEQQLSEIPYVLFSKIDEFLFPDTRVIIMDSIGYLAKAYKYGTVAFIGGGFTNSLHNIIEPAVFGLPVIAGKNCAKYPEARYLEQVGGAILIDENEFAKKLTELTESRDRLNQMAKNAENFVLANSGASDKIMEYVKGEKLLD